MTITEIILSACLIFALVIIHIHTARFETHSSFEWAGKQIQCIEVNK
jgi:hypothetical protein